MYQPSFGTDNPIVFENQEIYYETLGFLSKSDGTTAITLEKSKPRSKSPRNKNSML